MNKLLFVIISSKSIGSNGSILFLRVFIGVLMMTHGLAKLNNFGQLADSFLDPFGWGSKMSLILIILAELGCSALLILGLFTRLAAFSLLFSMAIAIFVAHGSDPFSVKEMAILYAGVYFILLFTGGGTLSADHFCLDKGFKLTGPKRPEI